MIRTCWAASLLIACSFDSTAGSGGGGFLGMETTAAMSESLGDTDSISGSGSDDGTATTLPPPPSCMGDGFCVGAAPAGWTGPLILGAWEPGSTALACAEAWTAVAEGDIGLLAPDPTCGCDCAKVDGACTVQVDYYREEGCSSFAVGAELPAGKCGLMVYFSDQLSVRATATPNGGACQANTTAEIPPATWERRAIACTAPALGACDDGTCLPAPPGGFATRYCVMATGNVDCPAGPYALRTVVYGGMSDDRNCTGCECGMTAPACGGTIDEFSSGLGCSGHVGSINADGSCHPTNIDSGDNGWSVRYEAPPPAFSCMPGDSTASGSASGTDPVTFCCNG